MATLLDVVFDDLKVRHLQNISGVWANPIPFDLTGAHAGEPLRGLHVETLQLPQNRGQKYPALGTVQQNWSHYGLLGRSRNARWHLVLLQHLLELPPTPLVLLEAAAHNRGVIVVTSVHYEYPFEQSWEQRDGVYKD